MPKMLLSFMLFALAGAPAQADQLVPQELWHGTVPLSALTSFRVLYQFFGRDIVVLPAAEYGDEGAGAVYEPRGTDIFMHPAWRGGAGWTAVEYGLRLPERLSARLRFSVGLDQAAVGQSDGVTFRVYVGPYEKRKILWENHVAGPPTDEVEVDLSEYSGREIVLGLETHPGPDKSTAYDWAMWYGPRLLIGEKPATRPLREVDRRRLQLLYRSGLRPYVNDSGTVVPCAGPMKTQTRLRELGPNAWRFEVIGTVGDSSAMSWRVAYDCDFSDGRLSGLKLTDGDGSAWQPCRGGGIEVKVGNQNFRPESDLVKRELVEARREGDTVVAKYRYTAAGHTVEWQMAARLTGPYLEIEASAPESSQGITGFSWGRPYGFRLGRLISLPYMHWGQVWQIDRGFLTVVPDLWHSSATAVAGDGVAYRACSDGHYNALSERLWVGYVPMLEMAIHNIPHPSSPYLKDMAQRPVIDIWGGTFDAIARRLVELAEYGVDHTFIIIHNWQRAGYDVQYPDVIPANEGLGGDEALRRLCKTANSIGHRIALHENYVDFYPDAPSFTEDDVALDSDGKWVKAWLHPSTRIQSFLLKPLLAVEYARRFAPEIHRRYGTSGAYLDVHTAVAPWHKVDFDARVPGAGKFTATLQSYRELFQFMREQHSGPLTGEGGNHAFWAGLFDGAEAQVIGGEKVQPLVAYDLLKVHPLNVNHGVGYWSRWAAPDPDLPIGRSAVLPLLEDKYRAQEITFGHAGFIATELLSTPALAVREFYLMRWLQELYGTAVPTTIEYEVAGRMLPMSEALLAMAPLERIHIAYDSGLELWVNWGEEPWAVRGSLLPQWGYLAKCEPRGFSQYCALKDGVIADFMQGRDALFADARPADRQTEEAILYDVRPRIENFRDLGGGKFQLTYVWEVHAATSRTFHVFVHFTRPKIAPPDDIAFQNDHAPPKPTSQWRPGEVIVDGPHTVAIPEHYRQPGRIGIMVGLYDEAGRVGLGVAMTPETRCHMGDIVVEGEGETLQLRYEPAQLRPIDTTALRKAITGRLNTAHKLVDFGPVLTDGRVVIRPRGNKLAVLLVPRGQKARVGLRLSQLPAAWRSLSLGAEITRREGDILWLKVD